MKLVTKDTGYAIEALVFLARQKHGVVSVLEIADALALSHSFLRKVLQVLCKHGLLESFKGKSGGFILVQHPKAISVDKIMRIFQNPPEFKACVTGKKICSAPHGCLFKSKMHHIEEELTTQLKQLTIASIVDSLE